MGISPFEEKWINLRVTTSCCDYMHYVVAPYIRDSAQQCPKCYEMDKKAKVEVWDEEQEAYV